LHAKGKKGQIYGEKPKIEVQIAIYRGLEMRAKAVSLPSMKFELYHIAPEIKKSLEELGFKRPTDIQFKSIPPILNREDVLAIAQTGTGKTAAFAIPVLHLLYEMKKRGIKKEGIKCLVMLPTHELAIQIAEVFEQLAKHTNLTVLSLYGGVAQAPQIEKLKEGVDVLVATPGRMFDLVSQGHINLGFLEILILDEADHMLDLGFLRDIQDVIKFLPRSRQTLFFSATINPEIKELAYSLVKNAIRIQISPKDPVAKSVDHSVAFVEMDDKRFFLERLIKEHAESKILVFVRTKVRAERVFKAMERVGIVSLTIHGDKEQEDRLKVMQQFKTGEVKVLIATDISARGIDIPNVEYVFNYDLPDVPENYVHRVGRTGRGVQRGTAVSFCSKEEKPILEEIQGFLGKEIKVIDLSKEDYIEIKGMSQENTDWKSLLKEAEEWDKKVKKPFKKK
jgi:ATP-dependent RNA helicase RhlE